jgi:hypothetical protein
MRMNQIVSGNNAYPEKLMLGKRPKAEYPQVTREMGDFLAGSVLAQPEMEKQRSPLV